MINANDNSRMMPRIVEFIAVEYGWLNASPNTRPKLAAFKLDKQTLEAYAGRYEFAPNFMWTLGSRNGRLYTQSDGMPDEELVPQSETQFASAERDAKITFTKNAGGAVTGFVWKANGLERTAPRIGPLIHSLSPQTDPAPAFTRQTEAILKAFAQGGKAVKDLSGVTPGVKRDFSADPLYDVAGIQSISFLAVQDVADRGLVRHDGKVSRILYCKMKTDKGARYILIHLTPRNLITDIDAVDD
jgi:hypothetical protein